MPARAQSLDGAWSGELSCSENLLNRNPGYSVALELRVAQGVGRGDRRDGHSEESFELQLLPNGDLQLDSTGRLKADTAPRWRTRFAGHAEDAQTLALQGQMFSGDGKTLVRERCTVSLRRTAAGTATDHRSFRVHEVTPGSRPLNSAQTTAGPAGLPRGASGTLYLPEDWLLGTGQPWHYRTRPTPGVSPVPVRAPTPDELRVVERARALMRQIASRAMVLVADGAIVEVVTTGSIGFETRLLSASMAKTVTALAAGKAVCAGHLAMDTRADALIRPLAGTDLGAATLRDLLMMASGTTEPGAGDYMGSSVQEARHYLEGPGNLEQLLATPQQSNAERGLLGKVRPGERFSYKARDPWTIAMMLEHAVGMPATRWIEESLLSEFRAEHSAILGTDRSGFFVGANQSIRLALIDWIRLAIYVEEQRRSDNCFGRFIRDLGSTHIRAPGVMNSISGYGYLTWTDNTLAPGTFWAAGYGGQRIGWSTDPTNRRIFLLFSNSADRETDRIYPLARDWFSPARSR